MSNKDFFQSLEQSLLVPGGNGVDCLAVKVLETSIAPWNVDYLLLTEGVAEAQLWVGPHCLGSLFLGEHRYYPVKVNLDKGEYIFKVRVKSQTTGCVLPGSYLQLRSLTTTNLQPTGNHYPL